MSIDVIIAIVYYYIIWIIYNHKTKKDISSK